MNRQDWERQVHGSNMNTTAKCIALVVGSFGNWTVDKTVEPGATKVANYAGVTRNTANEYINAMVEQGWLEPVGTGVYNTTIYQLCEVVADSTGKLARERRKMNPNSTAKLRRGREDAVADSTGNLEDSDTESVADTTEPVADSSDCQLPIAEASVAGSSGSNLKEPNKNNLDKNLDTTPVAVAPVVLNPLNLEVKEAFEEIVSSLNFKEGTFPSLLNLEGSTVLNFEGRDAVETKDTTTEVTPAQEGLLETEEEMVLSRLQEADIAVAVIKAARYVKESPTSEHWLRVKAKAMDSDFKPEITEAGQRVGHAAASFAPAGGDW